MDLKQAINANDVAGKKKEDHRNHPEKKRLKGSKHKSLDEGVQGNVFDQNKQKCETPKREPEREGRRPGGGETSVVQLSLPSSPET